MDLVLLLKKNVPGKWSKKLPFDKNAPPLDHSTFAEPIRLRQIIVPKKYIITVPNKKW